MIQTITSLTKEQLQNKKVLVRVDFNVQVFEGKILDDLRIRKTLPTISFLRNNGAKIILMSHIESKDGTGLKPVCEYINERYGEECGIVSFIKDIQSDAAIQIVSNMKEGDVVLLENLRTNDGEKKNEAEFSKLVASFGDMYVNDAFAVSHREHASVVGVPKLFEGKKYAGIQLMKEISNLSNALSPRHPFIFILGGAKFDTKLPLIQKFSEKADYIFLGGALLNDILKNKGFEVGQSLVSSGDIDVSKISDLPNLVIPDDVVVVTDKGTEVKNIKDVSTTDVIMDVGPSLTHKLEALIGNISFILWNGPMGNYEKGYTDQTVGIAKSIITYTKNGTLQAVLGGGDTAAAVASLEVEDDKNSNLFVSTGGGAMLEYLQYETLPGIEALV